MWFSEGKTSVIIVHRLVTLENANQILLVDSGRMVQRGKHQELVMQEGIYSRFLWIRELAEGWKINTAG